MEGSWLKVSGSGSATLIHDFVGLIFKGTLRGVDDKTNIILDEVSFSPWVLSMIKGGAKHISTCVISAFYFCAFCQCKERVYSSTAGVEQVALGLYIIRGDNM